MAICDIILFFRGYGQSGRLRLRGSLAPTHLIRGNTGYSTRRATPQSVFPNPRPGATVSLVVAAGIVGLMWGWLAYKTKSIRSTTLCHILFDFSRLGGRVYF
ncbi:MAG: CPBP family intramembrane glutamic endopeptidase [Anaerolineales bacterium]